MTKVAFVMDSIDKIKPYKDTTFGLMLEAQVRNCELFYLNQSDIFTKDGQPYAFFRTIKVNDSEEYFQFTSDRMERELNYMDVILVRQDPPVDMDYIYASYILQLAEEQGVVVANPPQALRDRNEKMLINHFPQCCMPTIISANFDYIEEFTRIHQEVVVKPLAGMGGRDIIRVQNAEEHFQEKIESMTRQGRSMVMVQKFNKDVYLGDKRILVIHGKPVPYALNRVPQDDEFRANLALGGKGEVVELTEHDHWIVQQVSEFLIKENLGFVGLDVVGGFLTEINITSPTCMREVERGTKLNIAGQYFDGLL